MVHLDSNQTRKGLVFYFAESKYPVALCRGVINEPLAPSIKFCENIHIISNCITKFACSGQTVSGMEAARPQKILVLIECELSLAGPANVRPLQCGEWMYDQ